MTAAHTPAPWKATRDNDARGNPTWRIDSPTVSLIAVLTYSNAGARAEGIQDARLIAAAPDMRAKLELAATCLDQAAHFCRMAGDTEEAARFANDAAVMRASVAAADGEDKREPI